jgi:4-hydroxyphenylpyruvate dioxygenase
MRDRGVRFLAMPATYYEDARRRVTGFDLAWGDLERLDIEVDVDSGGYLLQIFTETVIGPIFFEIIERKGNEGFGEGNFRALFESIERDQIRRGVLNPDSTTEARSKPRP